MSYYDECSFKTCKFFGIFLSIVFGAVVGVLFAYNYIPFIEVSVWIAFGMGVLTLILLVLGIFLATVIAPNPLSKCLAKNITYLLVGTIGTIISTLAALSIVLTPIFISVITLVAIGAFFFSLMIIGLIVLICCIVCRINLIS